MTATADPRAEARAAIVARYGSEAAALAPCVRERALRDATWTLVVQGDPDTGPSLMGWRDGPAASMPAEVRRSVSAVLPLPDGLDAAMAEAAYWTERAETRAALNGPSLPLWVQARMAIVEEILAAHASPPPPASAQEPDQVTDSARDQIEPPTADEGQEPAAQSGQPKRTRNEAREAVRALLGEDLTDREIARRVGVSPSTVAAVRKAEAEKAGI